MIRILSKANLWIVQESYVNRSNVVMPDDGAPFRYSFSALKDRHNAVEVN